ncbi:DUF4345 domain-containing protein [Nocardia cyriacigeorgica]|uniref:DUF4345 domain-containing protein n=1 Tax=Nocardia cyriacigeorgica TaxID=135487 RepID=A0A5R8PAH0_9NOCA|nr:DUF4345 family protein [Nocardia cyriacigeorgica]TLG05343.1 DUF4345 domain-containing protein [Nocardia cyriacigeorgica]
MRFVVLVLAAVFFGGMGLYAFAAPALLARPFRLEVSAPESRYEIRAVYGGFGIAMALVLGWSAAGEGGAHSGAALAVGMALAGMAVGRVVSRLWDAPTAFYPIWFYCLVEAVGSIAIFAVA